MKTIEMSIAVVDKNGNLLDSKVLPHTYEEQSYSLLNRWEGLRIFQSKNDGTLISLGIGNNELNTNFKFVLTKLDFISNSLSINNNKLISPNPNWGKIYYLENQTDFRINDIIETNDNNIVLLGKNNGNVLVIKINYTGTEPSIVWAYEYSVNNSSILEANSIIEATENNIPYYYIVGNSNLDQVGNISFVFRIQEDGSVPQPSIKAGIGVQAYIMDGVQKKKIPTLLEDIKELNNGFLGAASTNDNDNVIDYSTGLSTTYKDATVLQIKKDLNYISGDELTAHLYDRYQIEEINDQIHSLDKLGKNGYASLVETKKNGSITGTDGLLITSLENDQMCFNLQNFDIIPLSIKKIGDGYFDDDFENEIPILIDGNFTEKNAIVTKSEICHDLLCYCDDRFLEVTILPKETNTEGKCCYDIKIHRKEFGCKVHSMDISVQGVNTPQNFIIDLDGADLEQSYTLVNYCVDKWDGMKTLIIDYKDANNLTVCKTYRDIFCTCSCEDLNDMNKLKIEAEPVSGNDNTCCWDIRVTSKLPCGLGENGIEMLFPDIYNLQSFDEEIKEIIDGNIDVHNKWTHTDPIYDAVANAWKVIWQKPDNIKLTDKESGYIIGSVCAHSPYLETNFYKFRILNSQGEVCSNEWEQDINCKTQFCDCITTNIYRNGSRDCEFNLCIQFTNNCYKDEYAVNIIFPNSSIYIDKKVDGSNIQYNPGEEKVCLSFQLPENEKGTIGETSVIVQFINRNGVIFCTKTLKVDLSSCKNYCEFLNASIARNPFIDDGENCCYELKLYQDPLNTSGIIQGVKVKVNNNTVWGQTYPNGLPFGTTIETICVNKSLFKDNMPSDVVIEYSYQITDDQHLCQFYGSINPCTDIPEPCTPDHQEIGWHSKMNQTLRFKCPDNSEVSCDVNYTFSFRNIKDTYGTSIQRDIQVTSFSYNSACTCVDEVINRILMAIYSDADVMKQMNIPLEPNWNKGAYKCFENLRVITSDCYEAVFSPDKYPVFTKKCNDQVCCYAKYSVCYFKDDENNIHFKEFRLIDASNKVPTYCTSPCHPNNCDIWRPEYSEDVDNPHIPDGPPPFGKNSLNDSPSIDTQYSVYTSAGKNNNQLLINVESKGNGNVSIQIFDLIGNLVTNIEANKQSYLLSVPVDFRISSGIYFVNVNIDNVLVYRNTINIVK